MKIPLSLCLVALSLPYSSARAASQWMVAHSLSSELAEDGELGEDLVKLSRGRVLATGVALVTDEAVEDARTAMGMAEITAEGLPTLIDAVEAGHGLLIALVAADGKIEVSVRRYDVETEITAVARKTVGKPALKRTLKKILTDLVKPPKARKKKKRRDGEAVATEIDPVFRKVGLTVGALDAPAAKELGLRRPAGAHVTAVATGGVAERTLRANDVILKLDKKKVKNPGEIAGYFLQAALGDSFAFEVWRDGARAKVEVILGPAPEPEPEAVEEVADTAADTSDTAAEDPPAPEEPPPPPRKLGVRVRAISPELAASLGLMAPIGALVKSLKTGGVGERANLQPNDVILTINDKPVTHASNLAGLVRETYPRQRVNIEVWRDRKSVQLQGVFEDATTASTETTTP